MENSLRTDNCILLWTDISLPPALAKERDNLLRNFCGRVILVEESHIDVPSGVLVYLMGNIRKILYFCELEDFLVIKELSKGRTIPSFLVDMGAVPLNVHGVGVFFPKFFEENTRSSGGETFFERLESEHEFQELTDSNKPNMAFRKGIYITKVKEREDGRHFHLLRCSSNLRGPTDNLRVTDKEVIKQVNAIAPHFFTNPPPMNHVLAQIYYNRLNEEGKERKASIKAHSDKTKDMPTNGLMGFCTFYKEYHDGKMEIPGVRQEGFDFLYKNTSVLTKLRFKLKFPQKYPHLAPNFDVVLYPNSLFLMSLETNRLYTHTIVPSPLNIQHLPTRMGYVIRCSNVESVHTEGQTFLLENGEKVPLIPPDEEGVANLKNLYRLENSTDEHIVYGKVHFSLNEGDYLAPLL